MGKKMAGTKHWPEQGQCLDHLGLACLRPKGKPIPYLPTYRSSRAACRYFLGIALGQIPRSCLPSGTQVRKTPRSSWRQCLPLATWQPNHAKIRVPGPWETHVMWSTCGCRREGTSWHTARGAKMGCSVRNFILGHRWYGLRRMQTCLMVMPQRTAPGGYTSRREGTGAGFAVRCLKLLTKLVPHMFRTVVKARASKAVRAAGSNVALKAAHSIARWVCLAVPGL